MIRDFFNRINRRTQALLATGVLAVAGVGATVIGTAAPAMASASGCTFWGGISVRVVIDDVPVTLHIPAGEYCFALNGNGPKVNYTTGGYTTAWLYNYTEVVRFYNAYGSNYKTFTEPVHYGYAYGAHDWRTGIRGTFQPGGRVCGSLLSAGVTIARNCEGIS